MTVTPLPPKPPMVKALPVMAPRLKSSSRLGVKWTSMNVLSSPGTATAHCASTFDDEQAATVVGVPVVAVPPPDVPCVTATGAQLVAPATRVTPETVAAAPSVCVVPSVKTNVTGTVNVLPSTWVMARLVSSVMSQALPAVVPLASCRPAAASASVKLAATTDAGSSV